VRRYFTLLTVLLASAASAAEPDLSVGWIARHPKIDYVWNSTKPTVDGWPEEGSVVTWVANVRWLGSEPLRDVAYRWLVDGKVAGEGSLDFEAESLVQAQLSQTWTFDRSEIVFEIDHGDAIDETEERNNRLLVYSNALGVGLYVERTFWDGIRRTIRNSNIGASTFDDWMQLQIRRFNEMAAYAIYPETPRGVLDRWRVDEIHIVDDAALPLVPPYTEAKDWGAPPQAFAGLYPNVLDHTVDMQWGFPADTVNHWIAGPWTMVAGNSFIHELGHARTMVDSYAWNLSTQDEIRLDPAPPVIFSTYYDSREHGLMHFDWGHIDRYHAVVMNLMAGRRAIAGNYNEPWDLGWFLNDLPERNRVRLIRPDGTAIANRDVRVFRASGETLVDWQDRPYSMVFDAEPDFELRTDGEGVFVLPRNPFTDDQIVAAVDRANGVAIVEILDGETLRWAYLESLGFNLAYWRGETEEATHEVMADAPLCSDRLGPSAVLPHPEEAVTTTEVRFEFPVERNKPYELYYAVNGGSPVRVDVPRTSRPTTSMTLTLPPGRIVWWFVDPNPPVSCFPQRSSNYAFDHLIDVPPRRRAARK
jgi:hypothetical protein